MQLTSQLKNKLKNKQLTIGSWLMSGSLDAAEVLAGADFDWITIDMEHTAIDWQQLRGLVSAVASRGKETLVRVGSNDELLIKRSLDCGAHGVIVPMINSREAAEKAIGFVKYPPVGKRGVGLYRAQNFGYSFNEYIEWSKDNTVVILQTEHIKAVENIDAILATPGLDGIMIGPYDLSASMGYPGQFDREDVKSALKTVKAACDRVNLPMGAHVVQPDAAQLNEKIQEGYKFLAFGIDNLFLGHMVRQELGKIVRD